MDWHR